MIAMNRPLTASRRLVAACCALSLGLSGCHGLTNVNAPDLVQPGDLANAQGAITLFNGAMLQLYTAFGGPGANNGSYITSSGLMADELTAAQGLPGILDLDRRQVLEGSGTDYNYPLIQTRASN